MLTAHCPGRRDVPGVEPSGSASGFLGIRRKTAIPDLYPPGVGVHKSVDSIMHLSAHAHAQKWPARVILPIRHRQKMLRNKSPIIGIAYSPREGSFQSEVDHSIIESRSERLTSLPPSATTMSDPVRKFGRSKCYLADVAGRSPVAGPRSAAGLKAGRGNWQFVTWPKPVEDNQRYRRVFRRWRDHPTLLRRRQPRPRCQRRGRTPSAGASLKRSPGGGNRRSRIALDTSRSDDGKVTAGHTPWRNSAHLARSTSWQPVLFSVPSRARQWWPSTPICSPF